MTKKSIEELIADLKEPCWWRQMVAIKALVEIGGPAVTAALNETLQDKDEVGWVRWAAARALGRGYPVCRDF